MGHSVVLEVLICVEVRQVAEWGQVIQFTKVAKTFA